MRARQVFVCLFVWAEWRPKHTHTQATKSTCRIHMTALYLGNSEVSVVLRVEGVESNFDQQRARLTEYGVCQCTAMDTNHHLVVLA